MSDGTLTFAFMVASKMSRERATITDAEAATLAAIRAGTHVVVPKEPTQAMTMVGNSALSGWVAPAMHSRKAWAAMLTAAEPPA